MRGGRHGGESRVRWHSDGYLDTQSETKYKKTSRRKNKKRPLRSPSRFCLQMLRPVFLPAPSTKKRRSLMHKFII